MITPQASDTAPESSRERSVALIRNWPLTLFSWLMLPVLLTLGVWQLQRAEEKRQLNAAIDARLASQPHQPAELNKLQSYTPVRLLGYYKDEIRYLDNRTRDGRAGYEVLQVFVSGDDRWLINRGWIPVGSDRNELPEVTWPLAAKVVTGFLYPVADSETAPAAGPRIAELNRGVTSQLDLAQPEWSIRLSADSDTALLTDWQLINSPPERHTGYAVQWFAMAAALLLLWLIAATRLPEVIFKK